MSVGLHDQAGEGVGPQVARVLRRDGQAVLVLSGELDVCDQEELGAAVEQVLAAGLPVEVDCTDVTFMDSSVIAALARLASRAPGTPVLRGVSPLVVDVLALFGLDRRFDVRPG